jgi:hypothetical protein
MAFAASVAASDQSAGQKETDIDLVAGLPRLLSIGIQ